MKAKIKFIFFPGDNTPNSARTAVAVYWITFSVFFVRIGIGVGVPPFSTPREVEAAITVFGLLSTILIFYAFTIMRLSAGKLWARNVALFLTAFIIITTLYRLFADGPSSEQNNVVGLISVAAQTVAGLFLLTPESTTWFKSKIK
ncbi:hypothetical protein SBC1_40640 (plasmid) [Caballeronia sp. SBC1]|uniref:hypothetical protein n=1 Tax=unclassified Caballeronia TaxID=2646786 RepID=UPI0013E1C746|nr:MULTISPECIES: hypothetical protein [unclassified Caballeronia]QIE26660.1 hypothetical protein SBC2_47300 [Caballeronia sp. SBC2]QIN64024.1 hypothetical protein SBC1_40640 [Caballeronia sp. SBC1]